MILRTLIASIAALTLASGAAAAETHEVRMLNADPDDPSQRMVFEPAVLAVEPGDTVRFVAADPSHNAVSQIVPEGGAEFRGKINEEIEVTLETEGTYFYICQPHQALGMVGLILVGDHEVNFDAVVENATLRGRMAEQRFETYVEQAREIATAAAE